MHLSFDTHYGNYVFWSATDASFSGIARFAIAFGGSVRVGAGVVAGFCYAAWVGAHEVDGDCTLLRGFFYLLLLGFPLGYYGLRTIVCAFGFGYRL